MTKKCPICGKSFKDAKALRQHKMTKHPKQDTTPSSKPKRRRYKRKRPYGKKKKCSPHTRKECFSVPSHTLPFDKSRKGHEFSVIHETPITPFMSSHFGELQTTPMSVQMSQFKLYKINSLTVRVRCMYDDTVAGFTVAYVLTTDSDSPHTDLSMEAIAMTKNATVKEKGKSFNINFPKETLRKFGQDGWLHVQEHKRDPSLCIAGWGSLVILGDPYSSMNPKGTFDRELYRIQYDFDMEFSDYDPSFRTMRVTSEKTTGKFILSSENGSLQLTAPETPAIRRHLHHALHTEKQSLGKQVFSMMLSVGEAIGSILPFPLNMYVQGAGFLIRLLTDTKYYRAGNGTVTYRVYESITQAYDDDPVKWDPKNKKSIDCTGTGVTTVIGADDAPDIAAPPRPPYRQKRYKILSPETHRWRQTNGWSGDPVLYNSNFICLPVITEDQKFLKPLQVENRDDESDVQTINTFQEFADFVGFKSIDMTVPEQYSIVEDGRQTFTYSGLKMDSMITLQYKVTPPKSTTPVTRYLCVAADVILFQKNKNEQDKDVLWTNTSPGIAWWISRAVNYDTGAAGTPLLPKTFTVSDLTFTFPPEDGPRRQASTSRRGAFSGPSQSYGGTAGRKWLGSESMRPDFAEEHIRELERKIKSLEAAFDRQADADLSDSHDSYVDPDEYPDDYDP